MEGVGRTEVDMTLGKEELDGTLVEERDVDLDLKALSSGDVLMEGIGVPEIF